VKPENVLSGGRVPGMDEELRRLARGIRERGLTDPDQAIRVMLDELGFHDVKVTAKELLLSEAREMLAGVERPVKPGQVFELPEIRRVEVTWRGGMKRFVLKPGASGQPPTVEEA
jgi:hypothetical protein